MWNHADRDGIQKILVEHFGISIALVYRIRKKLNLPKLTDWKNHPGKRNLYKRIRKLYLNKERSTPAIGKIVKMCDQNVNKILKAQNVTLRPAHIHDNRYTQTSSDLTPTKLLQEIKRRYLDEKQSGVQIAKDFGIDQGTVTTKLRALGIKMRHNYHKYEKGGYPCQWCGEVMEKVWHIDGKRKQKFCSGRCRNMAKDYRRMLKGRKVSKARLESMEKFLKEVWGDDYESTRRKILDVKPIVKKRIPG
jgi:hypothetical protein